MDEWLWNDLKIFWAKIINQFIIQLKQKYLTERIKVKRRWLEQYFIVDKVLGYFLKNHT